VRRRVVSLTIVTGTLVLSGWIAPTKAAAEVAGVVPFALAPLVGNAGYFQAQGTCPARTARIRYEWSGASNGTGWGLVKAKPGPFAVALRMVASAPDGLISVKVICLNSSGRSLVAFGPVEVTSGTDLLELPVNSGTGRRIVYSLSAQQLWAVAADGTVARTHLVSGRRLSLDSGRRQTGAFRVRLKRVTGCNGKCPKFIDFHYTLGGVIGFHEIPRNRNGPLQVDSELGQPRSHGCIRQSTADALWLYQWAVRGDPVMVVD